MQDNYQDRKFSPITSVRPYPSIVMRATHTIMSSVAQAASGDVVGEVDVVEKKKKTGLLSAKLIKQMREENNRMTREPVQIPTLEPFGDKKFWDFNVFPKAYKNWNQMNKKDKVVGKMIGGIHALALLAPFTYSQEALYMFLGGYFFSCLGITLSYHRQLTHKSFETDKWLEHAFAFLGVLAVQGHPIEWVSAHRHHHTQCDDVPDPHSPYDGFFWSHMGWLFDSSSNALLFDTTNCKDLKKDDFYLWLKKNYLNITLAQPVVYFLLGGFPGLIWGFALRTVFSWHVTWAVNSVSHVWGRQMFKTDDLSMNNPLVGILALGEGWHNNHHAFEDSCRHGLKWW